MLKPLMDWKNKLGDLFHPVRLDITRHDEIGKCISDTFSENCPDILVNNNAGGFLGKMGQTHLKPG